MFGSRNKNRRSYQVIDDDYDENEPHSSLATENSLLPITHSRLRYMGHDDQQPLISNAGASRTMDPEVGYQGPPNTHSAGADGLSGLGGAGASAPMLGSSSQEQRWEHIENLDQFFTRVYEYHQGGGYTCIVAKHLFSLFQFLFIVFFSTFFMQCVDYDVLFRNGNTTAAGEPIPPGAKRHFSDSVVPNCAGQLHPFVVVAVLVAVVFWISRIVKTAYLLLQLNEIKSFYTDALNIEDAQLSNLTWHAVVQRICEVQPRLHLIVNHDHLSPIDLYHRILRFKNYFIAMVNKRILPPVVHVPFYGEVSYLPNGLKANLEWLLFWGYFSPWKGPYILKDEFKNPANLEQLTMEMEKTVTYLGLFNLIFFPLIFLYQVLYSFFTLAELVKREPGALGMRRYSNYGRYRLRHFNELEHELKARLNRSHSYATAYVNQFFSPLGEIAAKNIAFVAGALFGVLAVLSAWDEDVLQTEHVLTVMTVSGVVMVVCRSLISDENLVFQPEILLERVASEVHYVPAEWKGNSHTEQVRREFEQLFQLKSFHLIEELSSPLLTPFVLLFWIRPSCETIVRFLHQYSVGVKGLGHVCSFALMDVGKHGDPNWHNVEGKDGEDKEMDNNEVVLDPALDGKTELSVLHFAATNPEWEPPVDSQRFIEKFRSRMEREAASMRDVDGRRNLLLESVHALLVPLQRPLHSGAPDAIQHVDGPLENPHGMFASLNQGNQQQSSSLQQSLRQSGVDVDSAGSDMRVQALFIRELHADSVRHSVHRGYQSVSRGAGVTHSIFGVPQMSEIEDSTSGGSSRYGGGGGTDRSMLTSNIPHPYVPVSSAQLIAPQSPPPALVNISSSSNSGSTSGSQQQAPTHTPFGGLGLLAEHHNESGEHSDEEDDDDVAPPSVFHS